MAEAEAEAEAEAGAGAGAGAGRADAALLAPLTEDSFLHNLHVRYQRDIIYTYVGDALVSVNPCRALPLYSPELARAYLARAPYLLPPHLYALTASAYRCVRDRNESRCIVMTGESGAGKTEAARVCLQGVVLAGGGVGGAGGAGEAGAARALLAAGTLLEAFGNAATLRNHNASRFGKLLEIEFDFKGEPVGGHITHCESTSRMYRCVSRVQERAASVPPGERNFHVLYQLLAGADAQLLKRLKLQRAWEQYRILVSGGARGVSPRRAPPAARHDVEHFAFTRAAMAALGLPAADCAAVLRLLAFMLKLGNVHFEPQHDIDGTLATRIRRAHELHEACALVGVEGAALAEALTAPDHPPHLPARSDSGSESDSEAESESESESSEGGGGGACAGAAWARAALRRLLGALYSRLFTWLVRRANAALRARCGTGAALGVLDVYGFERLARNGLERLLINYAAERVQASVTGALLRRAQEEYAREGLAWRGVAPPPHEALAERLDGAASLLGALHAAATRHEPARSLLRRLAALPPARLALHPPHHFTVVHFGGAVRYSARGMASKERDALCRRCVGALAAAREPLLAELFAGGGSPRRPAALSSRQRALVGALARRLAAGAPPRLVACVRADAALRAARWDAPLVRRQLRAQAVLELARVRRAGWCESLCARDVLRRYAVLREPRRAADARAADGEPTDAVRAARALLRDLPIPSAEFAFGHTRVFVRSPRTVWELEALRAARVGRLVAGVQRAWRRHRARRRDAAAAVLQRAWRRRRGAGGRAAAARRIWRWWCVAARRRYLRALWARLPARHRSPACGAWPPAPQPRLLGRTDALLRALHHAWRCREHRARFDQTARNRMREKVTCSVLFSGRKAQYCGGVAHPFVGDYVRLRASGAWRRGARAEDRCVVFADACGKVARGSGRARRVLVVLSTAALLVLEARSLRVRRRVPAHRVWRLSLSPHADDVLAVHVRAPDAPPAAGCLTAAGGGEARRGDVLLRACHVLELATKLFLVVQNAAGAPPQVHIAPEFEANLGGQVVTVSFHALPAPGAPGTPHAPGAAGARLLRRHDRMDVLL